MQYSAALLILNLLTWSGVTSFTSRPSFLRRHSCRYPMNRRLVEPHSRSGRSWYEKSLSPVGIRSPDRPTHEVQPLYRLQYTQSCFCYYSLQLYTLHDGFGGLVVSMLASGTQVCGFKPGRRRWIFTGVKILSMPSSGGEVKESVPCPSFAACKRT